MKNNVCMKNQKGIVMPGPLKAVMNQTGNIGSILKAVTKTVKMTVVIVVSYILSSLFRYGLHGLQILHKVRNQ